MIQDYQLIIIPIVFRFQLKKKLREQFVNKLFRDIKASTADQETPEGLYQRYVEVMLPYGRNEWDAEKNRKIKAKLWNIYQESRGFGSYEAPSTSQQQLAVISPRASQERGKRRGDGEDQVTLPKRSRIGSSSPSDAQQTSSSLIPQEPVDRDFDNDWDDNYVQPEISSVITGVQQQKVLPSSTHTINVLPKTLNTISETPLSSSVSSPLKINNESPFLSSSDAKPLQGPPSNSTVSPTSVSRTKNNWTSSLISETLVLSTQPSTSSTLPSSSTTLSQQFQSNNFSETTSTQISALIHR
uniref:Uncharacterized protein n=1 Tax=Panagrolaimus sp. ES5 TaxID=591445 RepID=A0AC34GWH3_9BILA